MEKSVIAEGKTSNEAIENGLKALKCSKEDVEVKILESEDKRSFFSILEPRVVKVQLTVKEHNKKNNIKEHKEYIVTEKDINDCYANIDKFLKELVEKIGQIDYSLNKGKEEINILISGEGSAKLIGYRGETINALQTIISAIGNKNIENRVKVLLDIGGYKEKRKEILKELARKLEKTVKRNGKKIILEPMLPYERKIIHTELQDSKYVTTYSIGEEPRRRVVIDKK